MKLGPTQAAAIQELAARKCEALRLLRALPYQDVAVHNKPREYLCQGGNRVGKTLIAAARFAAIAMDQPMYDSQGNAVEMRLPHQKGRCLTMWIIGIDLAHIGQTIYRMLFTSRETFKAIRDEKTHQWRAFHPDDMHRENEARPASPLIPERCIDPKSWTWEKKGAKEFKSVTIWHPVTHEPLAMIYAFSSKGDPKAGDSVDYIWIDEAIEYPQHYAEWQARLPSVKGSIFWSSWPQDSNEALLRLYERADEESARYEQEQKDADEAIAAGQPPPKITPPRVMKSVWEFSHNEYIDEETRAATIAGWSEDERIARDKGLFIFDHLKMYPQFNPQIHAAVYEFEAMDDKLSAVLRANNGIPPRDWTRELILDPGTGYPAVLFCAIPPPSFGDYYVPYDEIYIQRLDANKLAKAVQQKVQGFAFHRFIIDNRAGRRTPESFNVTIKGNYTAAFKERGIQSTTTGSSFLHGSDNVGGRIMLVHQFLEIRQHTNTPKLRIVMDRCPNLVKQITNYKKDRKWLAKGEDKPLAAQHIDVAVALEYGVSLNPRYVPPPTVEWNNPGWAAYQGFKAWREARQGKKPDVVTVGPKVA